MSNVLDYLNWRGDLPLTTVPLCPVDTLLLSLLPYIRLEGIVPPLDSTEPLPLPQALTAYAKQKNADEKHLPLVRALAAAPRFAPLRILGAEQELDKEKSVQFAAVTLLLSDQALFVAFEGTDDTLIGWKEDLRMSYECPVLAQTRAVAYLHRVATLFPKHRIFTGGHSKGGNLAMCAAVHGEPTHRSRIDGVYNHDGPGFCDDTLTTAAYTQMRDRIHTFLPASSIVAVLLEHDNNYKIVQSTGVGLLQHDPYSWQIEGDDFLYTDKRTAFGLETEALVDRLVAELSPQRKRQFTQGLFAALESTGQQTLSGILGSKTKRLKAVVRTFTELDPEVRDLLQYTLAVLLRSAKEARHQ